jgi:hypothetical protein
MDGDEEPPQPVSSIVAGRRRSAFRNDSGLSPGQLELPDISEDSSESSAEGSDSEDECNSDREALLYKEKKGRCDSALPFTAQFEAMRLRSTSSELP